MQCLDRQNNGQQRKEVLDFWNGFRNGINDVDTDQILELFPIFREKTVNLWNTVTFTQNVESSQKLQEMMKQRLHFLKYGDRPQTTKQVRFNIAGFRKHPKLWTTPRLDYRTRELEFPGIDARGKRVMLNFLLRRIGISIDRLYQYLCGDRYRPRSQPIFAHPVKVRKISEIMLTKFFEIPISLAIHPLVAWAAIRMTAAKIQSLMLMMDTVGIVILLHFD